MNDRQPIPFPDEYLLAAYRDRTVAMLRRYNRAAVETGRLPSLLGREFFRARVTSYTLHTLEDAVIFVFDIERCLAELTSTERMIIGRIVLQEYSQPETARLMGCHLRTVERLYPDAIDHLTEIMLERGLLSPSILEPRKRHRSPVAFAGATLPTHRPVPVGKPAVASLSNLSIQACQELKNSVLSVSA